MIRRRSLPTALALLAVACLPPDGGAPNSGPSDRAAPDTAPPPAATELGGRPAEVVEVTDGDSLVVEIDGAEVEVRLLGVNAPERDECLGPEAEAALAALVAGRSVTVVGGGETDQFGRLLATVVAGGLDVNRAQVEAGMALALTPGGPGDADYRDVEELAWEQRAGLWSPEACGSGPLPAMRIADVVADPPGPDDERLDEEAVMIENPGDVPVDLAGWVLRDESSVNRFLLPAGLVLGPGERMVVTSGCGEVSGGLAWCAGAPIWNNSGDMALLLDEAGRVVDRFRYSSP